MMPLIQKLPWILVHSLWIAALFWGVSSIISSLIQRSRVGSQIKFGSLMLFLIAVGSLLIDKEVPLESYLSNPPIANSSLDITSTINNTFVNHSQLIATAWIVGSFICSLKFSLGFLFVRQCKNKRKKCEDISIFTLVAKLKKELKIRRNIQVWMTPIIKSPMTTGFLKPIVYLPISMSSGLSQDEIETLIYHELVHIKHNDYLKNICLVIIEILFYFNPFVLIMIKDIRNEMEFRCDKEVVKIFPLKIYLDALLKLQNTNSNPLTLSAKSNNSQFKTRIMMMINNKQRSMNKSFIGPLLIIAVVGSSFTIKSYDSFNSNLIAGDTIKAKSHEELNKIIGSMSKDSTGDLVYMINDQVIKQIRPVDNALTKADKMMKEIHQELIKDGLLNESKRKLTLMFQYSDLLNGKETLGNKYGKYKAIFNRYFPVYDSYATTRVFRFSD